MKTKELRIFGQPITDSNLETEKVTRRQAEGIARKRAEKYRRSPWGKDAHGFVFETERYFNIQVGFGKLKNA